MLKKVMLHNSGKIEVWCLPFL